MINTINDKGTIQYTFMGYLSEPKLFYENYIEIYNKLQDIEAQVSRIDEKVWKQDLRLQDSVNALRDAMEEANSFLNKMKQQLVEAAKLSPDHEKWHDYNVNVVESIVFSIRKMLNKFNYDPGTEGNIEPLELKLSTSIEVPTGSAKAIKFMDDNAYGAGSALVTAFILYTLGKWIVGKVKPR